MITSIELKKQGGKWLAAARTWMQGNFLNGETVIWGSMEFLSPRVTVKDIEELAAIMVAAAINETQQVPQADTIYCSQCKLPLTQKSEAVCKQCLGS